MTPPRQSAITLDVTVFVCPVCLRVGAEHSTCAHYESGSVGYVYYSRLPATVTVRPNCWTPVLTSLDSPEAA